MVCWQNPLDSKFFFFHFFKVTLDLVFWSELGDPFVSQNTREFYESHFLGRVVIFAGTIWQYGQISVTCTIPCESPFPPSRALFYTLFVLVYCIRYDVINRFNFFFTSPTLSILLRIIDFCFNIIGLYGDVLYFAISRHLVSLLRFIILSHVQVFSRVTSLICLLKYPYSCFSFYFCFFVMSVIKSHSRQ